MPEPKAKPASAPWSSAKAAGEGIRRGVLDAGVRVAGPPEADERPRSRPRHGRGRWPTGRWAPRPAPCSTRGARVAALMARVPKPSLARSSAPGSSWGMARLYIGPATEPTEGAELAVVPRATTRPARLSPWGARAAPRARWAARSRAAPSVRGSASLRLVVRPGFGRPLARRSAAGRCEDASGGGAGRGVVGSRQPRGVGGAWRRPWPRTGSGRTGWPRTAPGAAAGEPAAAGDPVRAGDPASPAERVVPGARPGPGRACRAWLDRDGRGLDALARAELGQEGPRPCRRRRARGGPQGAGSPPVRTSATGSGVPVSADLDVHGRGDPLGPRLVAHDAVLATALRFVHGHVRGRHQLLDGGPVVGVGHEAHGDRRSHVAIGSAQGQGGDVPAQAIR